MNATGGSVPIPSSDLRGKLVARRRLPPTNKPPVPLYQEQIQVVVTNPKAIRSSNFRDVNLTEVNHKKCNFYFYLEIIFFVKYSIFRDILGRRR